MFCNLHRCRPGGLQVEPSCNRVYVQHLSGKEEPRVQPGFERIDVDSRACNPSAGYEFLFEGSPATDFVGIGDNAAGKPVDAFLSDFVPADVFTQTRTSKNMFPEPFGDSVRPDGTDHLD